MLDHIVMHSKGVSDTSFSCYSTPFFGYLKMKCGQVMCEEKVMMVSHSPQYLIDLNPLWPEMMVNCICSIAWVHCVGMVSFGCFLIIL